ncbi:Aste57867_20878 [Aphanomyces stellatus]|uniref:Aste57867_20878 protein n=1 Tax=Aphanomyces stellatus TaxID=120398 RepID=A0A485LKS5_9STRA|nr:hypothetical protein As57867_020810 [Aphanomyces stellatus]VFT97555.1 Aste57867_20878 [Aphanomyces stellatus]
MKGRPKACCYVCLDATNGSRGSPAELMAPCECKAYIHRGCLVKWRCPPSESQDTTCPTCKITYNMEGSDLLGIEVATYAFFRDWPSSICNSMLFMTILLCLADGAALLNEKLAHLGECVWASPVCLGILVAFFIALLGRNYVIECVSRMQGNPFRRRWESRSK